MSTTRIVGASVGEQEIYDHLVTHVESERAIIEAYDRAARETASPAFAFLARLILDDERRHHGLLRELAETIRTSAELSGAPTPIPDLDLDAGDRDEILELTERFLEAEQNDQRELAKMEKLLKDMRDTTLWHFVLRLIEMDNAKHRAILEFIRTHARGR